MRRLLLLVGAVVFVDTLFFAALTPLLPRYAEELGLSKVGAGVLSAAYAAGALVGAFPGGVAAARFGVRPTVLAGLAGMSVTTLAFGLAGSIVVLDVARFLQGVSSAFTWTAALAWLVAAAPPHRRGELIGTAMAFAIGGALFGPVVGGAASVVGTGWAFGAVTVLGGGLLAWAWRMPAAPVRERQPLADVAAALRVRAIQIGAWLVAVPALFFGVLNVLAPLRLAELGHGALAISATFLVAAAAEATLAPVVGRVSDRRGRLAPLRAGLAASAVVTLVLPALGSRWALSAMVMVAAMAFGAFWAPALSFLADTAERLGLDHAYAFALVSAAWAPGAALGAAAAGTVAEATGDTVPYAACAAIALATLALVARVRLTAAPAAGHPVARHAEEGSP